MYRKTVVEQEAAARDARADSTEQTAKGSDEYSAIMEYAEKYIQEHYKEPISRVDIAAACYLSPSHFGRYFKKETGCTFINYLTKVRMQKAVELLSQGVTSAAIAQAVGYSSTRHFGRVFKQEYGCTPGEFRKLNCEACEDAP